MKTKHIICIICTILFILCSKSLIFSQEIEFKGFKLNETKNAIERVIHNYGWSIIHSDSVNQIAPLFHALDSEYSHIHFSTTYNEDELFDTLVYDDKIIIYCDDFRSKYFYISKGSFYFNNDGLDLIIFYSEKINRIASAAEWLHAASQAVKNKFHILSSSSCIIDSSYEPIISQSFPVIHYEVENNYKIQLGILCLPDGSKRCMIALYEIKNNQK